MEGKSAAGLIPIQGWCLGRAEEERKLGPILGEDAAECEDILRSASERCGDGTADEVHGVPVDLGDLREETAVVAAVAQGVGRDLVTVVTGVGGGRRDSTREMEVQAEAVWRVASVHLVNHQRDGRRDHNGERTVALIDSRCSGAQQRRQHIDERFSRPCRQDGEDVGALHGAEHVLLVGPDVCPSAAGRDVQ